MKKSTITAEVVRHIALLARLTLSPQEIVKFQKQLSSALDYITILDKIDTKDLKISTQIINLENVFRDDEIHPSLPQEEVLAAAKQKHNGYFVVPAVFEE